MSLNVEVLESSSAGQPDDFNLYLADLTLLRTEGYVFNMLLIRSMMVVNSVGLYCICFRQSPVRERTFLSLGFAFFFYFRRLRAHPVCCILALTEWTRIAQQIQTSWLDLCAKTSNDSPRGWIRPFRPYFKPIFGT